MPVHSTMLYLTSDLFKEILHNCSCDTTIVKVVICGKHVTPVTRATHVVSVSLMSLIWKACHSLRSRYLRGKYSTREAWSTGTREAWFTCTREAWSTVTREVWSTGSSIMSSSLNFNNRECRLMLEARMLIIITITCFVMCLDDQPRYSAMPECRTVCFHKT